MPGRDANHVPVCRKAKAAAKGAPAIAIRVRAQRIRNGVAKGTIEPAPAPAAATPKIRTGTQSGKIKTANNSPPRRRLTVNAAPIAPIKVRAGVHATSESVTLQSWFVGRSSMRPKKGAAAARGRPVRIQWARHFTRKINYRGV